MTFYARNVVAATNDAFTVNYVLEGSNDGLVWKDISTSSLNAVSVALPAAYPLFRIRADIIVLP